LVLESALELVLALVLESGLELALALVLESALELAAVLMLESQGPCSRRTYRNNLGSDRTSTSTQCLPPCLYTHQDTPLRC
jgi:hypothetical protein